MVLALAQVTETTSGYDSATIALFVVFVVSLTITAGLLLRDLIFPESDTSDRAGPWPSLDQAPLEKPFRGDILARHPETARATAPASPWQDATVSSPAWFNQAMTSQRAGAVVGISATIERLIDASNRGDLRAGFACYTPEHLARYQREHETDAGALERLSRMEPVAADYRIAIGAVRDITIDPPHRAYATVEYLAEDGAQPSSERFHFLFDQSANAWLIDAIEGAGH